MKLRNILILVGLASLITACIPSLKPFYTEKDLVFEQRLLGEWRAKANPDGGEVWKFEKRDENAYKLTVIEKEGKTGEFAAHLFRLKDQLFLDLIPTEGKLADGQADMVGAALFPGHLLVRVGLQDSALDLTFTDFDWLAKHLENNPKALAHHREDQRIVLTAEPQALQRFVLKHLGEGELFQKPTQFVR